MQLKIAHKLLNLSFYDQNLEQTLNSQEILNISENPQRPKKYPQKGQMMWCFDASAFP